MNIQQKIKIAITGGIGSGKSQVLQCLKNLGYNSFIKEDKVYTESDIDLMKVCRSFDVAGVYLNHYDSESIELEDYFLNLIGGEEK